MRYTPEHKDAARAGILQKAAERFCRDGIEAVGVRTLMADAGLTHGAFYAHFSSRDEVVAEAILTSLQATHDHLARAVEAAAPGEGLRALTGFYLADRHRQDMARGCAAAALAPEVARGDARIRSRFEAGLDAIIQLLAGQLPEGGTEQARLARARSIFAGMMGAIQLSRTVPDEEAAGLLADGREAALSLARKPWD